LQRCHSVSWRIQSSNTFLVRIFCTVLEQRLLSLRVFFAYGQPTGTSYILDDDRSSTDDVPVNPSIKYDRSGPVPIILVPQPSDDPNDPLVCNFITHGKSEVSLTVCDRIGLCGNATSSSQSCLLFRSSAPQPAP